MAGSHIRNTDPMLASPRIPAQEHEAGDPVARLLWAARNDVACHPEQALPA